MSSSPTILTLIEREPLRMARGDFSDDLAKVLFDRHQSRVNVDWPSPKTENEWVLTAGAWVGYLPVSEQFAIAVRPKVDVRTVFGMLEYAYRLKSFALMDGLYGCSTLEELYSRLASVLARRIGDRLRKGLLREYSPRREQLPYVRGRLDARLLHRQAVNPMLPCRYEEHDSDIEDNQILLWTLYMLARVEGLHPTARTEVRGAFRGLRPAVSLREFAGRACVGRAYHRLNEDYEPLHALCRLFLETRGPDVQLGERRSVPFVVNMDRLYELFVFEWLRTHLPRQYRVVWQERFVLSAEQNMSWNLDVLVKDRATGAVLCVLDTKYKRSEQPGSADLQQVVAYAVAVHCKDAVLCYPRSSGGAATEWKVGDVRIRRLTFGLDRELGEGGEEFLAELTSVLDGAEVQLGQSGERWP